MQCERRLRVKYRRISSTLVFIVSGASIMPVAAQQAIQPAQLPSSVSASAESATPGDIVVTAQRREQRARDVGIALTIVGAKDLAAINATNATDITRAVPNLKFNAYSPYQVVFNIRGVSQNDYGDQQEPPVAVYQDDSYSSSISTASFPIFDLSRVEVLRGPQGTLFGRNATGGAVQFISNQPADRLGGYLTGTFGSYNQTTVEGAISVPLTNTLSARISGIYDRDDGYLQNIIPGQPNRGADNHWAIRGILKYEPSSVTKMRLTLRYTESDHERQAGLYSLAPSCPNAQLQGEFLASNQVCAYWNNLGGASYNGNRPGSLANGYSNPSITPTQGGDPWKIASTDTGYLDRKIFDSAFRIDTAIGPVSIVSTTDYQHLSKSYVELDDGDPELPYVRGTVYAPNQTAPCLAPAQGTTCYAPGTTFFQTAYVNQFSQEIHASTTFGKNYLVVGAFGMILDGSYTGGNAFPMIEYDPVAAFTQKTRSYAFFAQDEWKFGDGWKLIGGLRYWNDHKTGTYDASELFSGFSMHFGPDGISYADPSGQTPHTGLTINPSAAKPDYSGLTARAEIDYKPSSATLIYASYNRGSKSGGFTFSVGTPVPGQGVLDYINNIPYRPEVLNAYELGLKGRLTWNTELNLAGFYYNYTNYQAFVQVGFTQVVRNLAAEIKGIEADLTTHPVRGLTFKLSGTLQSSRVSDVLLPDGITIITSHLPQTPGFSGNAFARYDFDLSGSKAFIQADSQYSGRFCFTVMCAPVERESSYHVENIRIGISPKGSSLELAAYVNNIFQRAYRIYAVDSAVLWGDTLSIYAKPRTWGVTATYRFGG